MLEYWEAKVEENITSWGKNCGPNALCFENGRYGLVFIVVKLKPKPFDIPIKYYGVAKLIIVSVK